MTRIFIAALALALVAGTGAYAGEVSAEAKAGVQKALTDIGCKVEDDDIEAGKGGGYNAEDVECKDGQYDMSLDKDFKVTKKKKED